MLTVDIPSARYELPGSWDGTSKKLITVPPIHLEMEHSLLSISKWEAKWKVPFTETRMTTEQFLDYCRCMTINRQKDPNVYRFIRQIDADRIGAYMEDSMTARIRKQSRKNGRSSRRMTSEYFYYLMIQYGIPFECEKWHFNRLIALIDCCQANDSGGTHFKNYREKQEFYRSLNDERRKMLGSRG